jgi:uncharacterized protein YcfJ
MSYKLITLVAAVALAGCQATGEQYQADVFDASQVNSQQEAKTIKIITVSQTKIKVSNEQNKKKAQIAGGLIGAVAGGAAGSSKNSDTALAGAAGGALAGAAAGSLVSSETLVAGVLLSYSEGDKIYTSAQVGQVCQFAPGQVSLMVKTKSNETRIQPNATCPVDVTKK